MITQLHFTNQGAKVSIEAHLAENTAALKTVSELLAKFLANNHVPGMEQVVKAVKSETVKPETKAAATATVTAPAKEAAAPAAQATPAAPAAAAPSEDAYLPVKEQLLKLIASKGSDAGMAVLSKFGVKNGKQLPADKYPEVLAAIDAALKAE